jgi:hypothetical protein
VKVDTKAGPSDASITPVVHEYEKRVSKSGKFARSPFVNPEDKKNYTVSKNVEEIYSMVCQHGFKTSSESNKEVVIDIDTFFINLGYLADSVSPGKQLYNMVAEVGIHIMKEENTNSKKITSCLTALL